MAGQNIIAAQDAHAAAQDARLEAIRYELRAETKSIRWVLGGVAILLSLIFAASQSGIFDRGAARISQGHQVAPVAEQAPSPRTVPAAPPEVP